MDDIETRAVAAAEEPEEAGGLREQVAVIDNVVLELRGPDGELKQREEPQ